jgi:hypothetical protein
MEKHPVTNICRLGAVFIIAVALTVSAHANSLLNPGFETVGTNATTAANWNQFGNAFLSGTNNTLTTIRTGQYSMQAGPTATNVLLGSGAYQDVAANPGDTWRLTGYILTWINAKVTGPDAYGVAQLTFLDSSSNVLQTTETPYFGQTANMPVNTWVPFQVDATAPAGTALVRTYILYVGDSQDGGNYYFDDLNLYKPGVGFTTGSVTAQPAVQVSWPTSTPTNQTDYQIQATTSLVFSNPPVVNVLTNGSFETNATPWFVFNGAGQTTNAPARTGTGVMKLVQNHTTSVAGCYQIYSGIAPGSVWDLQGYGYNWSAQPMFQATTRGLIKIVWLNNSGSAVAAVNGDTNLLGTVDFAPNAGVVSAVQMSSASPQNVWTFLEARATAPTNATQVQVFCLLVPTTTTTTETCLFDDLTLAQSVAAVGWQDFGPLWLGTSLTNQVFDLISANSNKFYRVTTP